MVTTLDDGGEDEEEADPQAMGDDGGEALSRCVGLSQNGMHRRRFAGRPPSTGSHSNDRFRVAHAIFSFNDHFTDGTHQTYFVTPIVFDNLDGCYDRNSSKWRVFIL